MPREYTPYAIFETTFLLADPRYKKLKATTKVLYVALWARAFQDRRDVLPLWYDTQAIRADTSLDTRTVQSGLESLSQNCLIEILADGRINVLGARDKGNIKWKDTENSLPLFMAKDRREEKRKEKKRILVDYSTLPHFATFWEEYPKGKGGSKKEACEQWIKFGIEKSQELISEISQAIINQKGWHAEARSAGAFYSEWPHACRWIKKQRWEDETPSFSTTGGQTIEERAAKLGGGGQ